MATTQEQKDKVTKFVEQIKELLPVQDAYIDDYGQFGNFSICLIKPKARLANGKKITFRNIIPTAKKLAREIGLIWRENNIYVADETVMLVDIDCQAYHANINKFEEQLNPPNLF